VLLAELKGSLVETLAKQSAGLANGFFAIRDDPSRLGLIDGLDHFLDQGIDLSPHRPFQL
jgi:hypothetical protein